MAQSPQQGHLEIHPEYLWKTIPPKLISCSIPHILSSWDEKNFEQQSCREEDFINLAFAWNGGCSPAVASLSCLIHWTTWAFINTAHCCSLPIGHLGARGPDSAPVAGLTPPPFLFLLEELIRTLKTWTSSKRQTSNKVQLPARLQRSDV